MEHVPAIVEDEGSTSSAGGRADGQLGSGRTAQLAEPDMYQCSSARRNAIGRARADAIQDDVRAQAVRDPQAVRARLERCAASDPERGDVLLPEPVLRTLVYKGMLMATQVRDYFPDLQDPRMTSALCMFHSRFSTNTFPSWKLAHPYRMIATTARSTRCAATSTGCARGRRCSSRRCSARTSRRSSRSSTSSGSDTACFDNALELLDDGRAADPAGGDDDDPGAVGRPREHAPGEEGLLRVPRAA